MWPRCPLLLRLIAVGALLVPAACASPGRGGAGPDSGPDLEMERLADRLALRGSGEFRAARVVLARMVDAYAAGSADMREEVRDAMDAIRGCLPPADDLCGMVLPDLRPCTRGSGSAGQEGGRDR